LAEKAICPICNKRRAERYCPAKGEKICAVDCGTEREVTIDCPSDCAYLIAAHRWETSHGKPLPESEMLFPNVVLPPDVIQSRGATLSGLAHAILLFALEQRSLTDAEAFSAILAMAETYRTLLAGIYYEKPPNDVVAAGLYATIARFLEDEKKGEAGQQEYSALKNSEIFHLLVFLLRFGRLRSNGRPRTRMFIDFLRAQFPPEMRLTKETPRIVMP
jgi:hypothetical protein